MITTEINILEHIQLSEQEIDSILQIAKEDCVQKLMDVSDYSINEFELNYSFDFICKVTVSPKSKQSK